VLSHERRLQLTHHPRSRFIDSNFAESIGFSPTEIAIVLSGPGGRKQRRRLRPTSEKRDPRSKRTPRFPTGMIGQLARLDEQRHAPLSAVCTVLSCVRLHLRGTTSTARAVAECVQHCLDAVLAHVPVDGGDRVQTAYERCEQAGLLEEVFCARGYERVAARDDNPTITGSNIDW